MSEMEPLLGPEARRALANVVALAGGGAWSVCYLLIIRRTFLDKVPGMPLPALCFNLAWEGVFSCLHVHPPAMVWVNRAWFALDVVMFLQSMALGRNLWPAGVSPRMFRGSGILMLAASTALILAMTLAWGDAKGAWSAFGSNFLMSALFLLVLSRARSGAGQSLWIAVAKGAGTLAFGILFFIRHPGAFGWWGLAVLTFLLDIAYAVLLARQLRRDGLPVWRRA